MLQVRLPPKARSAPKPRSPAAFPPAPPTPKPFLKWAGGKSQLRSQYQPYFPDLTGATYHEPFLGGGAVYFHLRPAKAVLSDLNAELIECYEIVREHPEALIEALQTHKVNKSYYLRLRARRPDELSKLERVSRFIFLNKTCYNGLYRVNRSGQFNVPYGRYNNPQICDKTNLLAVSVQLRSARLRTDHFESVLNEAQAGDFIYLDPPYQPLSATANFTSYTKVAFGENEQRQLASVFGELDRKGCRVMLSNSDTASVRRLYRSYKRCRVVQVSAKRAINSVGSKRGKLSEVLILNY